MELDLGDGWTARYRLLDQAGAAVVAEVSVFYGQGPETWPPGGWLGDDDRGAQLPAGGLTATRLRAVPVGPTVAWAVVQTMGDFMKAHVDVFSSFRPMKPPKPAGRRPRDPLFYAEIAARYVEACRQDPARPVAFLAKQLGRGWTRDRVRDVLHDARRKKMLTTVDEGRAGGMLTEGAIELLRKEK